MKIQKANYEELYELKLSETAELRFDILNYKTESELKDLNSDNLTMLLTNEKISLIQINQKEQTLLNDKIFALQTELNVEKV
jgi:hypothetical protein